MVTMLGWLSADADCASCWKRSRRPLSPARWSGRTLSATSRPRRVSRARYTSPIPPDPSGERISYAPNRAPATSAIGSHQITSNRIPVSMRCYDSRRFGEVIHYGYPFAATTAEGALPQRSERLPYHLAGHGKPDRGAGFLFGGYRTCHL